MRDLPAVLLTISLSAPAALWAGDTDVPPPLTDEHWNSAHTISFKTPATWKVTSTPGDIELTEGRGDGVIFRIYRRRGGLGLDSMHVECMLLRLAGDMDTKPGASYEYDFNGSEISGHKALDSAFVFEYDKPVDGERKWRQRNLTLVNDDESLCLITYAPNPVFKKSKAVRKLLTSLVESVKWP